MLPPFFFAPFWAKFLKSYVCTISNPHHLISLKTIGSGLCSLIFPKTSLIKDPGNLHCAQCPGKLNSSSCLTHLQGLLWKITPSSLKRFLFLASRTPHSLHSSSVHWPPLQSHLSSSICISSLECPVPGHHLHFSSLSMVTSLVLLSYFLHLLNFTFC